MHMIIDKLQMLGTVFNMLLQERHEWIEMKSNVSQLFILIGVILDSSVDLYNRGRLLSLTFKLDVCLRRKYFHRVWAIVPKVKQQNRLL